MKQIDKCISFLMKNGYESYGNIEDEFQTMHKDNLDLMSIDINDEEIVFIDGNGDFLHLPCNLYALIGALIHFSQISVGYSHD